jgi:hypothetical protein
LAVRVTVPPAHILPLFTGAAIGVAFTVTVVVYTSAGVQPLSVVPSLTVNEYTPVTVGVAVGFCKPDAKDAGPLHEYVLAPPDGLAESVTVPPIQMYPLLVGVATGLLFTVTIVVYMVAGAQLPSLTVSEYTVVTEGVAVGLATVVADNEGPLHEYALAPPDGLAVRVTVPPAQTVPLLVGAAEGDGVTVTTVV